MLGCIVYARCSSGQTEQSLVALTGTVKHIVPTVCTFQVVSGAQEAAAHSPQLFLSALCSHLCPRQLDVICWV